MWVNLYILSALILAMFIIVWFGWIMLRRSGYSMKGYKKVK